MSIWKDFGRKVTLITLVLSEKEKHQIRRLETVSEPSVYINPGGTLIICPDLKSFGKFFKKKV